MNRKKIFHDFYNSLKTIGEIAKEEDISEKIINEIWNNFSELEKQYRKMLIKKNITLEQLFNGFIQIYLLPN